MVDKRKAFEEPEFIVNKLTVVDVITASGVEDDEEFGAGEF